LEDVDGVVDGVAALLEPIPAATAEEESVIKKAAAVAAISKMEDLRAGIDAFVALPTSSKERAGTEHLQVEYFGPSTVPLHLKQRIVEEKLFPESLPVSTCAPPFSPPLLLLSGDSRSVTAIATVGERFLSGCLVENIEPKRREEIDDEFCVNDEEEPAPVVEEDEVGGAIEEEDEEEVDEE